MRCDVVVVGAGPAGALAAREIARAGGEVLLVDRSGFPRRKVCGCCLGAGALAALTRVGLGGLPRRLGAVPLRTFVPTAGGRSASLSLPGGCAVSREALDQALVDAAVREGAEFRSGVLARLGRVEGGRRVVEIVRGQAVTEVFARVVLDASGLGSGLTEPGGPKARVAHHSRVGLGATFDDADYPVRAGELRMAVGTAGYVGLVRIEQNRLNVAAAVDPAALGHGGASPGEAIAALLAEAGLPGLSAPSSASWRGTPPLTRTPHAVEAERVLRLGDAAGYVEPFTGEGMCWAMSTAVAVAPLALAGVDRWRPSLAGAWRRYDRAELGGARRLCRTIVPALRSRGVVRGALVTLGLFPALAGPFVRRAARHPPFSVSYSS